jgi:hypothetical protein
MQVLRALMTHTAFPAPVPRQAGPAFPASRTRAQSKTDWLFVVTLLNAALLSGGAQYFNIFLLAGINIVLQVLLLVRINFRMTRSLSRPAVVFYLYLIYSFLIIPSSGDLRFIAFRFHDILSALLIMNYILVRNVDLKQNFGALLKILIIHGFINWLAATFFFQFFSKAENIAFHRWLIFFAKDDKYLGIYRSQGLFWEPGIYQIFLNIALHFFLFYAKKPLWAALTFAGLVLTLSTTGVAIAAVQLAVFLFTQKQKATTKALKILLAAPFFVVYLAFSQTIVQDKVTGDRSGSYLARSFDTQTGLMVTAQNPLGIGFNPETYQEYARNNTFRIDVDLNTDRGQTNGLLILAYSTGIPWAIVILYFLFRQRIFQETRILFFLVLAGSLATSPIIYSPFIWLFIMSGMANTAPLLRSVQPARPQRFA